VSDAILSSGRGYRYRRAAAADASRRSFEPRDDDDDEAGTASDTNCERVRFFRERRLATALDGGESKDGAVGGWAAGRQASDRRYGAAPAGPGGRRRSVGRWRVTECARCSATARDVTSHSMTPSMLLLLLLLLL